MLLKINFILKLRTEFQLFFKMGTNVFFSNIFINNVKTNIILHIRKYTVNPIIFVHEKIIFMILYKLK